MGLTKGWRKDYREEIEWFEKTENEITIPKGKLFDIIEKTLVRERVRYIEKMKRWHARGIKTKLDFNTEPKYKG
jgi:hypothetical protein